MVPETILLRQWAREISYNLFGLGPIFVEQPGPQSLTDGMVWAASPAARMPQPVDRWKTPSKEPKTGHDERQDGTPEASSRERG
jgi:hypothetical protein